MSPSEVGALSLVFYVQLWLRTRMTYLRIVERRLAWGGPWTARRLGDGCSCLLLVVMG